MYQKVLCCLVTSNNYQYKTVLQKAHTPQLHRKAQCLWQGKHCFQCLVCGIIVQVSCTIDGFLRCMGCTLRVVYTTLRASTIPIHLRKPQYNYYIEINHLTMTLTRFSIILCMQTYHINTKSPGADKQFQRTYVSTNCAKHHAMYNYQLGHTDLLP